MSTVSLRSAGKVGALGRAREIARFHYGGDPDVLTAVGLLIVRLDEVERRLARVAAALKPSANGREST